ncbi:MAG: globin [Gammaproteobacteria bacterium]
MTATQFIPLALECYAEEKGDPTDPVFALMYERFPALSHFRSDDNSWENYMMQEIIGNLLQYAEDPDTALITIKDMTSHHQLIGVPMDVFKGFYSTLLEVLEPSFSAAQHDDMLAAWQQAVNSIQQCIERHQGTY